MRARLLACAALLVVQSAHAQDLGLRGEVDPSQVNADLMSRTPLAARRTPLARPAPAPEPEQQQAYRPQSRGATPPDEGDGEEQQVEAGASQFDDPLPGDAPAAPVRQRAPTTAALRQDAERQRRAAPNTSRRAPVDPLRTGTEAGARAGVAEEETTGALRAASIDALDEERRRTEFDNPVTPPLEGRRPEADENPYAALGMRAGGFILRPSLEQGARYTTNATSSPDPEPAWLSETTLRLNAVSDWSRHAAELNAYGTLRRSIDGAAIDEKEVGIDGRLSLDLAREYRLNLEAGYLMRPESASSPVSVAGALSQPQSQTLTAAAELEKDIGRLRFGIGGNLERLTYGNAEIAGGGTVSQEERNATLALARLRLGYEISPALIPFVEVEGGRRIYDETVDSSGYERSATRYGARAGAELSVSEKLDGELSAGWLTERIDDGRLDSLSGLALDADLRWSPMRGTIVVLNGTTTVEGTTTPGESGSVLYAATLTGTREIRANLTGSLAFGAGRRNYVGLDGHDVTLSAEAGLTWWLNRYLGLTTRARHERVESDLPGRDTKTSSVFVGLRLQR